MIEHRESLEKALHNAFEDAVKGLFDHYYQSALRAKGNQTQLDHAAEHFKAELNTAVASLDACLKMLDE